ncbi:MAG: CRISPR-associated endonuclease Cas1 [Cyanobacteria bacterium]|nr:CRISPR-associated endonuclease Cas1 [Cyanobacteriota bacterium]
MTAEPSPRPLTFPLQPIPAKAGLRRAVQLPDYLPARMLNEFVYCPRLFFYEWVDGVFRHSSDTVDGAQKHEKGDEREDQLPPQDELDGERFTARGIMLSSDRLGVIAKLDLIEAADDAVVPVDYKRGAPRESGSGPEGWPADLAQIAVQAAVLRDNGYRCDEGLLFYYETRQRVRVPITDTLLAQLEANIAAARGLAVSGRIPPPLVDSPKCPRCSLVTICLPDETIAAAAWIEPDDAPTQSSLFDDGGDDRLVHDISDEEVRRLLPARDDLRPLYITGFQLSVGKSGERLQVKEKGKVIQEARLNEVSQVNLFGPISITGAAVQALCQNEKPLAHFSIGGWFYGLTTGMGLKNVFLRRDQFRRADDDAFCLTLARDVVASKIRNQRTLLQRNHIEPPAVSLDRLKRLAHRAQAAGSLDALLGIEGTAAATYFAAFAGMIKIDDDLGAGTFDFAHRNRRPPRDPVNALLSFAYSMLARDLTIVCHAVGFDPFVGFYHQPRFGRPALALDLMEGFRPLLADSAVLSAINTRMIGEGDFLRTGDAVAMTQRGRTGLIRAYEQRMDQLVTHPVFGYRISYRRVLEVQVRLLARYITGELASYPLFETR